MSHHHVFDVDPQHPTRVFCTVEGCGFGVPAILLKSRVNAEAIFARKRCTQAVLDLLGIDRDGNVVMTLEEFMPFVRRGLAAQRAVDREIAKATGYPSDWPKCYCGEPVLDGHLTCGRVECDEGAARAAARAR